MIISGKGLSNVLRIYGEHNQVTKNANAKSGQQRIIQGRDECILSSGAQEFAQVYNAMKAISDVRQDKVDEFSEKIDAGNYRIDSKNVAERMLGTYSG